eukprot:scaffold37664_cov34-Phaeocystis_antarctica.AAC.1
MLALHSSTPISVQTVRALQPAADALEPSALAGAFDTAADLGSRQVGRLQPLATLRRLGAAAAAQPAVVLRLSEAPLAADASVRAAAAADVAILVGGAMDAAIPVVDARGHLLSEDLQPLPPPAAADLVDAATPYVAVVDAEACRDPTHHIAPPARHRPMHRTSCPTRRPSNRTAVQPQDVDSSIVALLPSRSVESRTDQTELRLPPLALAKGGLPCPEHGLQRAQIHSYARCRNPMHPGRNPMHPACHPMHPRRHPMHPGGHRGLRAVRATLGARAVTGRGGHAAVGPQLPRRARRQGRHPVRGRRQ